MPPVTVTEVRAPGELPGVIDVFDRCGNPERRVPLALLRALLHAGSLVATAARGEDLVGALVGVVDGRADAVALAVLDSVSVPADPEVDDALRAFAAQWSLQHSFV